MGLMRKASPWLVARMERGTRAPRLPAHGRGMGHTTVDFIAWRVKGSPDQCSIAAKVIEEKRGPPGPLSCEDPKSDPRAQTEPCVSCVMSHSEHSQDVCVCGEGGRFTEGSQKPKVPQDKGVPHSPT